LYIDGNVMVTWLSLYFKTIVSIKFQSY